MIYESIDFPYLATRRERYFRLRLNLAEPGHAGLLLLLIRRQRTIEADSPSPCDASYTVGTYEKPFQMENLLSVSVLMTFRLFPVEFET